MIVKCKVDYEIEREGKRVQTVPKYKTKASSEVRAKITLLVKLRWNLERVNGGKKNQPKNRQLVKEERFEEQNKHEMEMKIK